MNWPPRAGNELNWVSSYSLCVHFCKLLNRLSCHRPRRCCCCHSLPPKDAHDADTRATSILKGLGFSDARIACPTSALSGGWMTRVSLACAIFCRPGKQKHNISTTAPKGVEQRSNTANAWKSELSELQGEGKVYR